LRLEAPRQLQEQGVVRIPVERAAPPTWPTVMLAALASLATLSLLQGVVDILLPTLQGDEPFGFLFRATDLLGPAFFALYVLVHNLGLACLVPGFGFVAAKLERKTANRGLIGLLLAGAVVLSLLIGLEFLVQASDRYDPTLVVPLFVVESAGVLALAIPSARLLRGFVPTRTYQWALVEPFRKLKWPLVASCLLLAVASAAETWMVVLR